MASVLHHLLVVVDASLEVRCPVLVALRFLVESLDSCRNNNCCGVRPRCPCLNSEDVPFRLFDSAVRGQVFLLDRLHSLQEMSALIELFSIWFMSVSCAIVVVSLGRARGGADGGMGSVACGCGHGPRTVDGPCAVALARAVVGIRFASSGKRSLTCFVDLASSWASHDISISVLAIAHCNFIFVFRRLWF